MNRKGCVSAARSAIASWRAMRSCSAVKFKLYIWVTTKQAWNWNYRRSISGKTLPIGFSPYYVSRRFKQHKDGIQKHWRRLRWPALWRKKLYSMSDARDWVLLRLFFITQWATSTTYSRQWTSHHRFSKWWPIILSPGNIKWRLLVRPLLHI